MATVDKTFGVAFSGGGIRSAAFCSGVLRRLLTKKAEPDYLSCVSGGGYVGSAYVQWKSKKNEAENDWEHKFFDNLKKRAGPYCNWQNGLKGCCKGLLDSIILSLLIVLVVVIVPISCWGSFACPIAFMVNLLYGRFVDGTLCRKDGDSLDCRERTILFSVSFGIFFLFHLLDYLSFSCCENKDNYTKMKWAKLPLWLIQQISGATFAFTFFPWFINDFLRFTRVYTKLLVVAISAVFWFFAPVLRKYSSLVMLIYAYSYVVFWRVYKREVMFIKYTDNRFRCGMAASLFTLALFSVGGDYLLRLVHKYNRWRLQRAFYFHEDKMTGSTTLADLSKVEKPIYLSNMVVNGWRREYNKKYCLLTMSSQGISVIDEQPSQPSSPNHSVPTTSGKPMALELTSTPSSSKIPSSKIIPPSAESDCSSQKQTDKPSLPPVLEWLSKPTLTTSSSRSRNQKRNPHLPFKGVSLIDQQPTGDLIYNSDANITEKLAEFRKECLKSKRFAGKLKPSDIKLSSAMAMSAAAISPHIGKYESEEEKITHFLTICGLEMAGNLVSHMREKKCNKCAAVLNFAIFAMFVSFGCAYLFCPPKSTATLPIQTAALVVGVILGFLLLVLLVLYCVMCSSCRPNCHVCTDLHKWFLVHLPSYRFICSLLNIITVGEIPPAMMHLSDGGHFENMGLLPLLKLRLPYILVVDGSHIPSDEEYAKEIVNAMQQAREILDCSFTTCDGGDVLTHIKNEYVKSDDQNNKSRMYEFKVHYCTKGDNQRWEDASEGHIVLIAPRNQPVENEKTWGDKEVEEKANLNSNEWGLGPYLNQNDIDNISGCAAGLGCCDCCYSCSSCTNCCSSCLVFPRHATANQFFTPRMFAAYHREGYSACMECDKFLTERAAANAEAKRAAANAEAEKEVITSADSREEEITST